ncbi:helix-turn-helix domain-containing protein [Leadbettera azotonutricia]|uniref:Uncharacterized protein n=1 Tax=Leadbettera azotonutricia (strain ATCC BAA-888 / DSM 13862 / ZAS-9) TaxID=545695 RepID=F5YBI1_LEAAZ|nr:helix-turn-helix domain-containing protein [Leadbettera azotonutricia]AEF83371.1 hypothetical protein TREAZ_0604 [Leadbettera azotonutricia ZAS-9]
MTEKVTAVVDEWLTPEEFCERIKIPMVTLKYWIKHNQIKYRRWGQRIYRIPACELMLAKDAVE